MTNETGQENRHRGGMRAGTAGRRSAAGFTLIELLVVIAMIAILMASGMPALNAALDRGRVSECRAHLTCIALAATTYRQQHGAYPESLDKLVEARLITDPTILLCSKTGAQYHYAQPAAGAAPDFVLAACQDPRLVAGQSPLPHARGRGVILLHLGGQIEERRRPVAPLVPPPPE